MKLVVKNIDLREKTISRILNNDENTKDFVNEIRESMDKINFFVNNIDAFSNYEKFYFLKLFCNVVIEPKDYLRMLTMEYKTHYTDFINIKTYMIDELGNNIEYFGVTTKENIRFNNERLEVKEIRNLIKTNKFLILKVNTIANENIKKQEKYEKHACLELDNNIDENSVLFKYILELFKKEILKKEMLLKVRNYYYELMNQIKSITDLSTHKKEKLAIVGKRYKEAYDKAVKENDIPRIKRIIVSHKKNLIK